MVSRKVQSQMADYVVMEEGNLAVFSAGLR